MAKLSERMRRGWNAFKNKDDPSKQTTDELEPDSQGIYQLASISSYYNPARRIGSHITDRTIVSSIYNRIATDVSDAKIQHIKTDQNGGFLDSINSGLNNVLTVEANCDQTGRAFVQDMVESMLEEGVIAAVPIDTSADPNLTDSYDIYTMRVGKIVSWYPRQVDVEVYNDRKGMRETIRMLKRNVAIIENPFYAVMNEPSSTLKRLIYKLSLMDAVDEIAANGKLDLILQLPYVIKSDSRKEQAEKRIADIERQLEGHKYGIAYTDGTEKIVQLNRSVENNLMSQVEYLTSMLYGQLGINQSILDGTADENTMNNYYKRNNNPILNAIADEFKRKFISKTAQSQNQTIAFYRNPFNFTPAGEIAEVADKFARNEILAPNEIRTIIGYKPSTDPNADELRNRNISMSKEQEAAPPIPVDDDPERKNMYR